jgi:glycosyltransferase involved in cell wall biosynthesis
MAQPEYSLLIPARNEAARIDGVVRAVFSDLGENPAWEVCIADDVSDDGTYELLLELSRAFPFRLLRPPANLGRGAIRNFLAGEAKGRILVFLDGDSRAQPGFIKAWEGLDPDAAWMGRISYDADPPSGFSRFLAKGSGMGKVRRPGPVPAAYFVSQNFRISKDAFLRAGGFRTDLKTWGGEDVDLAYKLAHLGIPLRIQPTSEARHPSVTGLKGYFARLEEFGRANLPTLIADHPALAAQFKLRLARPPWSLLFLNPILDALCRILIVGIPAWPWPYALYRYAIFNRYARGYLRSTNAQESARRR